MGRDQTKETIEEAKRRFEADLHTKAYARVHHDSDQLERLLSLLGTTKDRSFVDLGTGDGYVAMALAARDPTCVVTGLDIAEEAIDRCTELAKERGLENVRFRSFGGVVLPFGDNSMDGVLCRYAFHHFPAGETTLADISRITRRHGRVVFSDPLRNEADTVDFVNDLQRLKKDGHVRIYRRDEIVALFGQHDLELLDSFETSLCFTRDRSSRYQELLSSTPSQVLDAYGVHVEGGEINVKFDTMTAVFLNQKTGSQQVGAADAGAAGAAPE